MATTRKTTSKTTKKTTATASKPASSMTAAAKRATSNSAPAAAPAAPVVVNAATPVVAGPMMRKPELVAAIVAKTGMKKKDVKPVVEATLAVLGSALQNGRELNLQPLGKVKVNREKKMATGKVLIAKIRQPKDLPTEMVNPDPKDMDGDGAVTPTAAE